MPQLSSSTPAVLAHAAAAVLLALSAAACLPVKNKPVKAVAPGQADSAKKPAPVGSPPPSPRPSVSASPRPGPAASPAASPAVRPTAVGNFPDAVASIALQTESEAAPEAAQLSVSFFNDLGGYLYKHLKATPTYPTGSDENTSDSSVKSLNHEGVHRMLFNAAKYQADLYFDLNGAGLGALDAHKLRRPSGPHAIGQEPAEVHKMSDGSVAVALGPKSSELVAKYVSLHASLAADAGPRALRCDTDGSQPAKPLRCTFQIDPVTGSLQPDAASAPPSPDGTSDRTAE